MSINVLKRKSRRYQAPISGQGKTGFSLVGTRRNIGVVGPTNLAKSVTRTRERVVHVGRGRDGVSVPQGHGGCCGTYKVSVSNSGSCCTNDPSIVKKSVKNTQGMIDTKHKWMKSKYPNWWVQTNSETNSGTQGQYIEEVKSIQLACSRSFNLDAGTIGGDATEAGLPYGKPACSSGCSYFIGGKKYTRTIFTKNLKQWGDEGELGDGFPNKGIARDSSEQTAIIKANTKSYAHGWVPHFPNEVNHNGCDENYTTWESALAAGAWPEGVAFRDSIGASKMIKCIKATPT
jgi:hypothetical protein